MSSHDPKSDNSSLSILVGFGLLTVVCTLGACGAFKRDPVPKITLVESEWACTASHPQTVSYLLPVGKVMIPQTRTDTICDQYTRK